MLSHQKTDETLEAKQNLEVLVEELSLKKSIFLLPGQHCKNQLGGIPVSEAAAENQVQVGSHTKNWSLALSAEKQAAVATTVPQTKALAPVQAVVGKPASAAGMTLNKDASAPASHLLLGSVLATAPAVGSPTAVIGTSAVVGENRGRAASISSEDLVCALTQVARHYPPPSTPRPLKQFSSESVLHSFAICEWQQAICPFDKM